MIEKERLPLVIEELRSREPAEVETWLKRLFGRVERFSASNNPPEFSFTQSHISMGKLAINRTTSTGFEFETVLPGSVLIGMAAAGAMRP